MTELTLVEDEKELVIQDLKLCPVCKHPFDIHGSVEQTLELESGDRITGFDIICTKKDCTQTLGEVGICFGSAHEELLGDDSEDE